MSKQDHVRASMFYEVYLIDGGRTRSNAFSSLRGVFDWVLENVPADREFRIEILGRQIEYCAGVLDKVVEEL